MCHHNCSVVSGSQIGGVSGEHTGYTRMRGIYCQSSNFWAILRSGQYTRKCGSVAAAAVAVVGIGGGGCGCDKYLPAGLFGF